MKMTSYRFLQWMQLLITTLLSISAWLSANLFLCGLSLLGALCALVGLLAPTPDKRIQAKIALLQQQGVYPQQGQATDEDVQRLLQAGHKLLAVRLYRELHNVPLKQAVEAVKQLA